MCKRISRHYGTIFRVRLDRTYFAEIENTAAK